MSASGERVPVITETRDHEVVGNTAQPGALGSSIRQRRKIERNTSAPLPGMLQVSCALFSTRCARKVSLHCFNAVVWVTGTASDL